MRGAGERSYPDAAGWVDHSPTSRMAADSINPRLSDLHRAVYRHLRDSGGSTDEQGQVATGLSPNTYRPRRRELELHGWVRNSGRPGKTASGRAAVVWEVAK